MTIHLNDLIGKPFSEDGYGPDTYSCYGLAVEVFKRYGFNIPKTNISVCACKAVSEDEIKKHIGMYWKPIKHPVAWREIGTIEPYILLIKAHPGFAQHIGVWIGDNKMIHTSMSKNTCVESITIWKDKIQGIYKYTGRSIIGDKDVNCNN